MNTDIHNWDIKSVMRQQWKSLAFFVALFALGLLALVTGWSRAGGILLATSLFGFAARILSGMATEPEEKADGPGPFARERFRS